MSSTECPTTFCNKVGSNDLATLIGVATPVRGRCSAPGAKTQCDCQTGYLSGTKLCTGTGCTGEPVTLCDNLSGNEFVCGGAGQPCCDSAAGAGICTDELICALGTCTACGGPGEACCAGSKCDGSACCHDGKCIAENDACMNAGADASTGTCRGGTCVCGQMGDVCCPATAASPRCTDPGTTCDLTEPGGRCVACGAEDALCCGFGSSGTCNAQDNACRYTGRDYRCRKCGVAGGPCCPGNRCAGGCCIAEPGTSSTPSCTSLPNCAMCVGVGESCGKVAGVCGADGSCGGTCGAMGQACCGTTCTGSGTTCVPPTSPQLPSPICQSCGDAGMPCCGGAGLGASCTSGLRCVGTNPRDSVCGK